MPRVKSNVVRLKHLMTLEREARFCRDEASEHGA